MRNLVIPIGHLVMLAELDDKEAGQMAKAIALYANEGTVQLSAMVRSRLSSLCFALLSKHNVSLLLNEAKSIRPMP